jgi:S1-C subfamily serine protease
VKSLIRSPFVSALLGGVLVAVVVVALGIAGEGSTKTVVGQAPISTGRASSSTASLTPHDIYARDAPGVVYVRALVVQTVENPFDLTPQQQSSESRGSGFLIDRSGRILTNFHVVDGAQRITVQFEDRVVRAAKVVGQDANNDLALLKVNLGGLQVLPLKLGDSSSVQVGDPTLAIGNPFGLDRTLTSGIVSALQRQIQAPNGFSIDNVIQTDAPINPGNSGGPLIDAAGRVIGINSQIATGGTGRGSVGIAFAVPINTAQHLLPQLEQGGQVRLAYLGITGTPAAGTPRGVQVETAEPSGPAAQAGLKQGDVVTSIDGHPTASMADVQAVVSTHRPGQSVTLRVVSRRRARTVVLRLGVRPAQAPQ